MPSKKKTSKTDPEPVVEPTPVVPIPVEPTPVVPIPVVTGTCLYCHSMLTGSWRGPTCLNGSSPRYKQRVKDADSCAFFSSKGSPAPLTATDEGLYDPEPRTALQDMLDRETEERDD